MIFVSTSSIKVKSIKEAVEALYKNGFINIEISGGAYNCDELRNDLSTLKNKYRLNYIWHNYFFSNGKPLVINLASLDNNVFNKSVDYLSKAIELAENIDATKFGFHAGFFIEIEPSEIGKEITHRNIYDREKSTKRFCEGFNILKKRARNLKLYIENNVLSLSNYRVFNSDNPFMLTDYASYKELRKHIDFNLLLDVGHLKVSANSLKLDFYEELSNLIMLADYIHVSENSGIYDEHRNIDLDSQILNIIKKYDLSSKIITIEISGNIEEIINSYRVLNGIVGMRNH